MGQWNFTLIAVTSAFLGAIATILARTLLRNLQTQEILAVNFFIMAAVLLLLSPLFYTFDASPITMGLVLLIAFIDTAANYLFFKTFERTDASAASPLLSLAPAFTFFFSWMVLNDTVQTSSLFASAAILALILIFSIDFSNFSAFKRATLWPAVLSSILFGASAIPAKYLLNNLHAINAPTLYMFRAGFIALFSVLLFNFNVAALSTVNIRIVFFRGLIVISQWILLYYALTLGSAGSAVTLGNITPIFVFLLSIIFLKEKPTLKKAVCAGLILLLSFLV
jgi:drug/metabolite transporter (DMT)-like permease